MPPSARVLVETPGEAREEVLRPGMMVGRSPFGLRIRSPEVSEAHALCSLREDGLVLLPLRGRLVEGDTEVDRWPVTPGAAVELARGVLLRVLALEGDSESWVLRSGERLVPLASQPREVALDPLRLIDPRPGGLWAWHTGEEAWLRLPSGETIPAHPGLAMSAGGVRVTVDRAALPPEAGTIRVRPVLELTPGRGVRVRADDGSVLHTFPLRQAELLTALYLCTRSGPAHWTRVVDERDGSFDETDARPFDKVREQIRAAAERLGLPVPFTRPRSGFLDLNRVEYRVVRVAAKGVACPTCGRGEGVG